MRGARHRGGRPRVAVDLADLGKLRAAGKSWRWIEKALGLSVRTMLRRHPRLVLRLEPQRPWQQDILGAFAQADRFVLSSPQAARFTMPCLYVRRRSDGTPLYIGSSLNGIVRPLSKGHVKARLGGTGEYLEVYVLPNLSTGNGEGAVVDADRLLRLLEGWFIQQEQPLLNRSDNGVGSLP